MWEVKMASCPKCNGKDFIGIYGNDYSWEMVKRVCLDCDYEENIGNENIR